MKYGVAIVLASLLAGLLLIHHRPDASRSAPVAPDVSTSVVADARSEPLDTTPILTSPHAIFSIDVLAVAGKDVPHAGATVSLVAGGNESISMQGWAIDSAAGAPAAGVALLVDGTRRFRTTYGGARTDVASALKNTAYTASAWQITFGPHALARGHHSLRLLILAADRTRYFEPAVHITIKIR